MKKVWNFILAIFVTIYAIVAAALVFIVGTFGLFSIHDWCAHNGSLKEYWTFLTVCGIWSVIGLFTNIFSQLDD